MPVPTPPRRQPDQLGLRATKTGGTWEWPRDTSGGCKEKASAMRVLDRIDGQEKLLVRAMYDRLLRDAERGRLRFGARKDVSTLVTKPWLLELRVQVNPGHKDVGRRHLLRLYFAEPQSLPSILLALRLTPKPRAGDPDGTQDRHIREANQTYESGEHRRWGISSK